MMFFFGVRFLFGVWFFFGIWAFLGVCLFLGIWAFLGIRYFPAALIFLAGLIFLAFLIGTKVREQDRLIDPIDNPVRRKARPGHQVNNLRGRHVRDVFDVLFLHPRFMPHGQPIQVAYWHSTFHARQR